MDRAAYLISTCFGLGLRPGAPGTYGSLAAFIPTFVLLLFGDIMFVIGGVAIIAIGTWAAERHATILATKDPSEVIIDEVAGQMIAFAPIVFGLISGHLFWWFMAFVLFRVFDILKPFPVCWLDRHISGGIGIMADDIAAGIMAFAVLALVGFVL